MNAKAFSALRQRVATGKSINSSPRNGGGSGDEAEIDDKYLADKYNEDVKEAILQEKEEAAEAKAAAEGGGGPGSAGKKKKRKRRYRRKDLDDNEE